MTREKEAITYIHAAFQTAKIKDNNDLLCEYADSLQTLLGLEKTTNNGDEQEEEQPSSEEIVNQARKNFLKE